MKNDLQLAKGVRDLLPEEKIARNQLVEKLREIFELYGYNPIETPVLERFDLFASKFGLGEASDAMKETFKLSDQGKRDLVLRTEFTMSLARYIGMNDVKFPFKRYQIGKVFRDGPVKLGRYREFWQCDVDCVGVNNLRIEAELIELAQDVFKSFGLDVEIQINSRNFLNTVLDYAKIEKEKRDSFIITIDKLDKIKRKGVEKELLNKGFKKEQIDSVLNVLEIEGSNDELIKQISENVGENDGLKEIRILLDFVKNSSNVRFLPTLARGLAYYTGVVFEVFLKDSNEFNSSLAGGGRYDDMIGGVIGDNNEYPAVGISFGLNAIYDVLDQGKMIENKKTLIEVYVCYVSKDEEDYAYEVCSDLRSKGIKTNIDYLKKNVKKNLDFANKMGINYCVILGEDEVKSKKITLKDMKTGKQTSCTVEQAAKVIKQ